VDFGRADEVVAIAGTIGQPLETDDAAETGDENSTLP